MTGTARFRYDTSRWPDRAGPGPDGPPARAMNETISMVERLAGRCPRPRVWAGDLMELARGVHLADQLSRRDLAPDGWTRSIELTVQLVDPRPWRRCADQVSDLLDTLTGDRWTVRFRAGGHGWNEALDISTIRPTEVALFSGGLDSAAYAACIAGRHGTGRDPVLLAVSHHRGPQHQQDQQRRAQDRVWDALERLAPGRLHRIPLRQVPHLPYPGREAGAPHGRYGTRSRGLLLAAVGVYVAAAYGVDTVAVPANGLFAVNPALTPARVGAASSRAVHPLSLYLFSRLIEAVGGTVRLTNPLWRATKADACRLLLARTGRLDLLTSTVSCRTTAYARQPDAIHCGCCLGCLVRRAAIRIALDGDDPTRYQRAPWTTAGRAHRHDLLALLYWLDRPFTARDLAGDVPLPPAVATGAVLDVIGRSRAELRAALRQLIPAQSPYRQRLTLLPGD